MKSNSAKAPSSMPALTMKNDQRCAKRLFSDIDDSEESKWSIQFCILGAVEDPGGSISYICNPLFKLTVYTMSLCGFGGFVCKEVGEVPKVIV